MRDDAAVGFAGFPNVPDHLANGERGFVWFPSELCVGNSAPDVNGSAMHLQVQHKDLLGGHARDRINSELGSGQTSNLQSAAYNSVEVQYE
jgi:hypothetical protein